MSSNEQVIPGYPLVNGYEELFWQFWAVFEALRRLGFSSADIRPTVVTVANSTDLIFSTVLHAQDKNFVVHCGSFASEHLDYINKQFVAFTTDVNESKISDAVLDEVWQRSQVRQRFNDFVTALVGKGFVLPVTAN